jgi:sporulation protein YabP
MKELVDLRLPVTEVRRNHHITLENRERIILTGISDVLSFNEHEVEAESTAGPLTIFGQNLHISKLNLEDSQLTVDGFIEGFEYTETVQKGGMWSRLFK